MTTIPILQVRQPWAWAYCAGKIDRHGVDCADDYNGPRAIVTSNTKVQQPTARAWLTEQGIADVPLPAGLPIGALIGFVWSTGCCGRADLSDDMVFQDAKRFFLILSDPLEIRRPVVRGYWNIARGLPIGEAIQFTSNTRTALAARYVSAFRAIERGESVEGISERKHDSARSRRN